MTLEELKKLAEAATPQFDSVRWKEYAPIYMAKFDPQTILALIELCQMQHEALEVAFNYDGDVFGVHHNAATDALIAYENFGGA